MRGGGESMPYEIDGRQLPSVTEILRATGAMGQTHQARAWASAAAMDRGTAVHDLTRYDDEAGGGVDAEAFAPGCGGYLDAWRKLLAEANPRIISCEERIVSAAMGYGGTLDRVLDWRADHWLVDIKTGSPEPWHRLQLAAYTALWTNGGHAVGRVVRRAALYLRGDGTYDLREHTGSQDRQAWLACLAWYRWLSQEGLL
jgi:hypothetical protein